MIHLAAGLYIGDSADERYADFDAKGIGAVLNVAQDLQGSRGWTHDGVEYAQVGLVDGPGNPLAAYHAAVLTLVALRKRGQVECPEQDGVLVVDHTGGRALAVCLMYAYLVGGFWWDEQLEVYGRGQKLPTVHAAHKAAYERMDWGMMGRVLNE